MSIGPPGPPPAPPLPPIQPVPGGEDKDKALAAAQEIQKGLDKLLFDLRHPNLLSRQTIPEDLEHIKELELSLGIPVSNNPELLEKVEAFAKESDSTLQALVKYFFQGGDEGAAFDQLHTLQSHLSDLIDAIKNS